MSMSADDNLIRRALSAARETRQLVIGSGILSETPKVFVEQFGNRRAVLVADSNTWRAAGEQVQRAFANANRASLAPFIFTDPALYAEHQYAEQLQSALASHDAIPVAVGS